MPHARFDSPRRSAYERQVRAFWLAIPGALALVAALAPIAEAGVSAQHNETLVVV